MRRWPVNAGPEAMVRLASGGFIVLAETRRRSGGESLHPGLLFDRDPVGGGSPQRFIFAAADGYRPVDLAALPDGRVLVLLRRWHWGLPPRFTAQLALANPRDIRPGEVWRAKLLATLAPPLPVDNFEGVAITPGPGDALIIWVISDDNRMALQQTLLLKLNWRPEP